MATRFVMVALATLVVAGCTLEDQTPPNPTGPSELGLSVGLTASPDTLTQDGGSQSLVTATVRDQTGRTLANVSLRAEIVAGGQIVDFGSLSARNAVTGNDGRATFVYTAPPAPIESVDTGTIITILVTPGGYDASAALPRSVDIRLVPPGVIVPGLNLTPSFIFAPTAPKEGELVRFDASASTGDIAAYLWAFGDGSTGSGVSGTHVYTKAGSYEVSLTLRDPIGRAVSTSRLITVGAGTAPSAAFVFSPSAPAVNEPVYFNASESAAAAGRTIAGFSWEFGDGTGASGQYPTHIYTKAGTYVVSLTVTDDIGKSTTTTKSITIGSSAPTAAFTMSPTAGGIGTIINVNAASSTASPGRTIQSYAWDFGCAAGVQCGTASSTGATSSTVYLAVGTYTIQLTITDDQGNTATTTKTITIS